MAWRWLLTRRRTRPISKASRGIPAVCTDQSARQRARSEPGTDRVAENGPGRAALSTPGHRRFNGRLGLRHPTAGQEMPSVRRLTAILAADVAGYSRLMGTDEEGTHERLRAHLTKRHCQLNSVESTCSRPRAPGNMARTAA